MPLDDRGFERVDPDIAGRPQLVQGNSQLLFNGMRLSENGVIPTKNKSHSITAALTVPKGGAEGVIITQGGNVGGYSLYAKGGTLKYCYNFFGIELFFTESTTPIPVGEHQVRMEFKYDGGGLAKGADITLYVDGKPVGTGRVKRSIPMSFSSDDGADVGRDSGAPTSPDYGPTGNAFNGDIAWVQIDLGTDDHDHLISAEERFQLAMARQ